MASPVAEVSCLLLSEAFLLDVRRVNYRSSRIGCWIVGACWGRLVKIPLSVVDSHVDGVGSKDFVCLLSSLKRNGYEGVEDSSGLHCPSR